MASTSIPAVPDVPESALMTVGWMASDGIDLMSPDATFIRASIESWSLAQKHGTLDGGYPGFARAMREAIYSPSSLTDPDNEIWLGSVYYRLLTITDRPDGITEARYCSYRNLVGNTQTETGRADRGTYSIGDGLDSGMSWVWTYIRSPGDDGTVTTPPGNQVGPNRTPTTDVFGSWTVHEVLPVVEDRYAYTEACKGKSPGTPDTWPPETVYSDDPPIAARPDPGWPSTN